DARLITWAETLTPAWLAETLTYTSQVDGATRTRPRWLLVSHLFNHQTHHRGQVTTLLTQQGHDVGSTDLPFMPGLCASPGNAGQRARCRFGAGAPANDSSSALVAKRRKKDHVADARRV